MPLDREQLLAIFSEELAERCRELERGLLELAQQPTGDRGAELLRELFRAAHTLKGAAHSVGAPAVARIARELEDTFDRIRDDPDGAADPHYETLLAAVDRLEGAAAELDAGSEPAYRDDRRRDAAGGTAVQAAAPRRPGSEAGPQPARVSPADLEEAVARAGELGLVAQRVAAVEREVGSAADAVRAVRDCWQRLRDGLAAAERDGGLDPATRVAADQLDGALQRLAVLSRDLPQRMADGGRQLERATDAVKDAVQQLSMVRFDVVCAGLDRSVRDIATATGKQVRLEVGSGDLELDRAVATALRDPLLHLVRNAVDHGVERPDGRRAAGKPDAGNVRVAGEVRSGQVVVTVSDDGAGIDPQAVRAAAQRRGIDLPADDSEVPRLLFTAGLSTSGDVTDVSGRGVGLDVVRASVEASGGTARIVSTPGRGTTVTLTLPLTLSTMRAVLVDVRGETVAVPATAVVRVVRVAPHDVVRVDGRDTVAVDGRSVVLADLGALLDFGPRAGRDDGKLEAVVVGTTEGGVACTVDAVHGEQDVTVRPFGPRLRDAPGVLGGIVLADGTCGVLLHAATWVARARQTRPPAAAGERRDGPAASPHVLLAEDTLTTRTLERSILETAGYEVTVAADGAEAWRLLQRHGADLVVTDVDMPEMDGFELCRRIRASTRFSGLPVVLVTSLADDRHRARGLEVGATAYFVKSAFDQAALLDTIARLL